MTFRQKNFEDDSVYYGIYDGDFYIRDVCLRIIRIFWKFYGIMMNWKSEIHWVAMQVLMKSICYITLLGTLI